VTYASGWADYGSGNQLLGAYRHLGRCYLQGLAKRTGVAGAGLTICTLPVGYRPAARLLYPIFYNGTTAAEISVETDGRIIAIPNVSTNGYVSLSNVSFRVA
jgi:hypothetical protein